MKGKGTKGEQEEGWTEEDEPNFTGSFYSRSKAWSEKTLRESTESDVNGRGGILILRLRMPFDGSSQPRNLIVKLKKFARVLDQPNSITSLQDFLSAAGILIDRHATGIYNMVNEGAISPYHIMELYREIVDLDHHFERLLLGSLSQVVRAGRSNCILSTGKLKREGITMRPVEEAVRAALLEFKKSSVVKQKDDSVNTICVQ